MMRNTEAIIEIDLVDIEAKDNSIPGTTSNQSFGNVSLLKSDYQNDSKYMTMEWNFNILDGSMEHFNNGEVPYWSTSQSDNTGAFSTNPYIDINFSDGAPHSSAGITLIFAEDYPKVEIEWFNKEGVSITKAKFTPDKEEYFCRESVKNYYSLRITFYESEVPGRFVKLKNIYYGRRLVATGDEIMSATVSEELDPISSEISINTFDFELHSDDKEFNILNPVGTYALLQPKQEIRVKEMVDTETIYMGTYYIDEWESTTETRIKFKCIDGIGIIDKTDFKKGKIYDNVLAGTIIDEIMNSAGWTKYEVSSEIRTTRLSGYIPICSHRQALQQVAFAARAVADCSRSDKIKIYRPVRDADYKIRNDRLFPDDKIDVRSYVSDISITAHAYKKSSVEEDAFNGTLLAGLNEVTFDGPFIGLQIAGGSIVESGYNYAIIRMAAEGDCIITGYRYEDSVSIYNYYMETIPAGEVRSAISIKGATLISEVNAYFVAHYLLEYYLLRKQISQRFIVEYERIGRWVNIESQYGLIISGGIERMTIDLTGGFLADAYVTGYNTLEEDYVYTGKEIHTGERIGVI